MTSKDNVIAATDLITQALTALIRVNYDNSQQSDRNMRAAAGLLSEASTLLLKEEPLFTKATGRVGRWRDAAKK